MTQAFQTMPIKHRHITGFRGREAQFVSLHRDSHMTLSQIAAKYDVNRDKMLTLLPPPDLTCPFGNHTRLWRRSHVIELFGENIKETL